MRDSYGLLFEKVYDELTLSMENTRENINVISSRLGRGFPELKRKLSKAKSIEDILIIFRSQCNLTDVTRLTTMIKLLKVDQLSADVSAYKSEMKTACRILRGSIKDDLSQYQHLIFKLTVAENEKDILALLRKTFLSELPRVDLHVKSSKKIYVTSGLISLIIIYYYWKKVQLNDDTSSEQKASIIVQLNGDTSSEQKVSIIVISLMLIL